MKIESIETLGPRDLEKLRAWGEGDTLVRQLRAPLLAAFDIYKSNVLYGLIEEDAATHEAVLTWYRALLDRDPDALTNVPAGVLPYVKGGAV